MRSLRVLLLGMLVRSAVARMLPSSLAKTLRHNGLHEAMAATVLVAADECLATYSRRSTPFLSPLEAEAVRRTFEELVEVSVAFVGGYSQAERRVAVFSRAEEFIEEQPVEEDELVTGEAPTFVRYVVINCLSTAVSVLGNFVFDRPTQTDFMEAILNCRNTDPLLANHVMSVVNPLACLKFGDCR